MQKKNKERKKIEHGTGSTQNKKEKEENACVSISFHELSIFYVSRVGKKRDSKRKRKHYRMRPQSAQPLSRLYTAMNTVSGGSYPTQRRQNPSPNGPHGGDGAPSSSSSYSGRRDTDESGAIGVFSESERVRLQRRREIRMWNRQDVREHLTRDGSLRAFTVFVPLSILEDELARQQQKKKNHNSSAEVPLITASFGNPSKRRVSVVEALYLHHIDGNALLDLQEADLMQKVGITQLGIAKAVTRVVDQLCCKRPVGVPTAWCQGEEELFADVHDHASHYYNNNQSDNKNNHNTADDDEGLESFGIPAVSKSRSTGGGSGGGTLVPRAQQQQRPMSAMVGPTSRTMATYPPQHKTSAALSVPTGGDSTHLNDSRQHHHHSSSISADGDLDVAPLPADSSNSKSGVLHATEQGSGFGGGGGQRAAPIGRPQSAPMSRLASTKAFSGRYADLDPFAGWEEQLERKKHPLRHAQFRFSKLPQTLPNHHHQHQRTAAAGGGGGAVDREQANGGETVVAAAAAERRNVDDDDHKSTPNNDNNKGSKSSSASQTNDNDDDAAQNLMQSQQQPPLRGEASQRQAARFPLETVVPEKPEEYRMGPLERERRQSVLRSSFQSLQMIASSPTAASAGTQGLLTLGWLVRSFAEAYDWDSTSVASRIAGAYEIMRVARQGAAAMMTSSSSLSGGGGGSLAVGRCRPSSSPLVRSGGGGGGSQLAAAGRAASPPSARSTPLQPPLEQLPDRASPLFMDQVKLRRGDFRTIVCYICDKLPPHDFDAFFQYLSMSFGKDKQEKTRRELAIQQLFALKESLGPVQSEDVREVVQMCRSVEGCVVKLPRRRGTLTTGAESGAGSLVSSRTGSPTHHPQAHRAPQQPPHITASTHNDNDHPLHDGADAVAPPLRKRDSFSSASHEPQDDGDEQAAVAGASSSQGGRRPSIESIASTVSVSNFSMPSTITSEWFLTFLYEALVEVKAETFDRCMLDLRMAAERAVAIAAAEKNRRATTVLSQKELEELISNETSVHRPIVLLLPPVGLSFNPSSMVEDSFRQRKEKQNHRSAAERQQAHIAESMGVPTALCAPPMRQHMLNMYSAASESTIVAMLTAVETLGCEKGFWLFVDCVGCAEEDAVLRRLCRLVVTQRHVHAQCRIFVRCGVAHPHELPQIAKTIAVVVSLGGVAHT